MLKAIALQIALLAGYLIFARGFLPPTRLKLGVSDVEPEVPAQFDKLVLMVVDAMRSDFAFSDHSSMHELHRILQNGHGYAFTAYSDPPTVTLPRLKGLTTGASPNFLDAVINIAESDSASTLDNQDSWIEQLHLRNKTMHMFGDDTWLNLFPNKFAKSDGTASFYVADFTEVDVNVTRHLADELDHPEWDVMVLHYLGLDHIGHKGGPNSVHMPEKQREMSEVVSTIYERLDESTLFVLLGDHGMNEVGNHGGASDGETSAAMAFLAKKFDHKLDAPLPYTGYEYYSEIRQVDFVPTLATLLGIPTPQNSLGVFIADFLPLWEQPEHQQLILDGNCRHLELDGPCNWETLREQQQFLMRTSSSHVLPYMYAGVGLIGVVALVSGIYCLRHVQVANLRDLCLVAWWAVIPIAYFIGMLGSSTVEEEHYIWFWLLSGLLAVIAVNSLRWGKSWRLLAGIFICFRVMRGWNTPGQKWTALTDTADVLAPYPSVRLFLVLSTFVFLAYHGFTRDNRGRVLLLAAMFCFSLFKMYAERVPVSLTWMIWVSRLGFLCAICEALMSRTEEALTLIGLMQTRQENIPLWIFFFLARKALVRLKETGPPSRPFMLALALASLCLEYVAFFAVGGSNSMATIDLSNAYNGVSGYNIPLVALLTYLGNWAPSLYFSTLEFVPDQKMFRVWFYSLALGSVTLACLLLRHHLFIWTVFSPKLLYAGAWLLFHEILATNIASFLASYL